MKWIDLNDIQQLRDIMELSKTGSQVIFKHSTRCFISSMIKSKLERIVPPGETDFYCLNLLRYRHISNKIASEFNVHHQSPQILLIKDGECIYDESHNGIDMNEIAAQVK